MNHRIYLGVGSHVVCLDSRNGNELWRTKLNRSNLLTVAVQQDLVIAHAGGHLFGLSADDGTILWTNQLSGLGYGYCLIATENAGQSSSVQAQQMNMAAENSARKSHQHTD